jgi:hypothetical protein
MHREASFVRIGAIVLCVLAAMLACSAQASSCKPRQVTYYVGCRSGQCTAEFRAVEIPAFRSCGRRLVVEDVDAGAGPFVTSLVEAANPGSTGLWQVRLPLRSPYSTDSDIQTIKGELASRARELPRSLDDWRALLGQRASWLVRVDTDASSTTVVDARREAEGIARWEWWSKFADASFYWLSALAALVALVRTTRRFFFHLHNSSSDGRRRRLWACVLGQAAILGGCIAIAGVYRFDVWVGLLLVLGILLLWLVQAWAYLHARWLSSPNGWAGRP